ncbi:hypothetical protein HNP38_000635 [Chryseobacterium defluvii]|uniref:Uncharacterized protein n=1 Tax=Chryseobacterium defluvii TaxID=160396 RepID=A0A840KCU9_9FLAO|nr:DUF4153 domain-containing protein [Chryseobacterium defluvii]MBB4805363.1 hypothetical protein [Chryseobacterium defluvii]
MKTKFLEIIRKADDVIFRYPMVLVMALLASIGAICMFEYNRERELFFVFSKFTICCCLGISLMFAIKMLSQRIGKAFLLELAGTFFLIGFYFILPKKEKEFTEVYGYIIAVTALLSHLLVSFAAFLNKDKELGFWQYNKNLFINIFLTAVFTGVLTGGIELAILAVDKLFDFNFDDKLYTDTFYVLAIFGSCFIFLLFNEKGLKHLEKDGKYPVILKFFAQFILIPLLLIYLIILYFYSIKILINWELPRGWVSYLVLAYSIVGVLALLLVYPLKEDHTKSWVRIFSKLFYFTIIPLIILLFTAIFTRILEYGYTEPRYFVLLLALWLLSVVIYFIFSKRSTIKFIPVSLFLFGAFALIFPYFNAFSTAKRSQKSELMKLLEENKLLENDKISFQKKVADTVVNEIANKFEFLAKRKQKDFLVGLVPNKDQKQLSKDIESVDFWAVADNIRNSFPNKNQTSSSKEYERLTLTSENDAFNIGNYQYLINLNRYNNGIRKVNGDEISIIEKSDDTILKIILNSKEEADFTPAIHKLMEANKNKTGMVRLPEISMESDLGKYHLKIIFTSITKDSNPYNKSGNIYYNDAVLLIKEK